MNKCRRKKSNPYIYIKAAYLPYTKAYYTVKYPYYIPYQIIYSPVLESDIVLPKKPDECTAHKLAIQCKRCYWQYLKVNLVNSWSDYSLHTSALRLFGFVQ